MLSLANSLITTYTTIALTDLLKDTPEYTPTALPFKLHKHREGHVNLIEKTMK